MVWWFVLGHPTTSLSETPFSTLPFASVQKPHFTNATVQTFILAETAHKTSKLQKTDTFLHWFSQVTSWVQNVSLHLLGSKHSSALWDFRSVLHAFHSFSIHRTFTKSFPQWIHRTGGLIINRSLYQFDPVNSSAKLDPDRKRIHWLKKHR